MDRPVSLHNCRVDLAAEEPFALGSALIDPTAHEAQIAGRRERIQPQTMKVLLALHQRCGELVTRDELIDRCWDGRIVGNDVINRCILLLRRFATRAGGFAIETVPKAGYRLIKTDAGTRHTPRWPLAAALVAALLGLTGIHSWRHPDQQGDPPMPSVALLPINFDASDPRSQRLALATGDSLAYLLRDSGFTPRRLTGRPAGGKTTADLLVDGSIHANDNSAEADIRVEETTHGTIIFSKRLSVPWSEAFGLPDRIAAKIATNLNWTGALMILDRRRPTQPRIVAELLKQVSLIVEDDDYFRAYEISRRIAPQAPDSAMAQVALAFNTGFIIGELPRSQRDSALALGRAAAVRALALAPDFGDAYVPWCLLNSPLRRIECEARMRAGQRADPDAPFVAAFLANFLHRVGRNEEALALARQSLADDPYKPAKMTLLMRLLDATGQVSEANQLYRRINHYWPDYPGLKWSRASGILERNDFVALAAFKRSLPLADVPQHRSAIAFAEVAAAADRAATRQLCPTKETPIARGGECMIALSNMGDFDRAYRIADTLYPDLRAASDRDEDRRWLEYPLGASESLLTGSSGTAMRSDPRFFRLAARIGLLDYWRSGQLPDFCRTQKDPVCARLRRGR